MRITSNGQRTRSSSSDEGSARSARRRRRRTTVRPARSRSSARRTCLRRSRSSGRACRPRSVSTGRSSQRRRRRSMRPCIPTTSIVLSAPRTRRRRASHEASWTPTPRASRFSCPSQHPPHPAPSRATTSRAVMATVTDGAPHPPQRHRQHQRSSRSSCRPFTCPRVRPRQRSFRESADGLRLRWRTSPRQPSPHH